MLRGLSACARVVGRWWLSALAVTRSRAPASPRRMGGLRCIERTGPPSPPQPLLKSDGANGQSEVVTRRRVWLPWAVDSRRGGHPNNTERPRPRGSKGETLEMRFRSAPPLLHLSVFTPPHPSRFSTLPAPFVSIPAMSCVLAFTADRFATRDTPPFPWLCHAWSQTKMERGPRPSCSTVSCNVLAEIVKSA